MTIHYHGTPINPRAILYELSGKHFCVSFAYPNDVAVCHKIGQSVLLDNGAFTVWRQGKTLDWHCYYEWCESWLSCPTTWAVIPDVIDGGAEQQDRLVEQWPLGLAGAPVWHLDESVDRLLVLCDVWPRVCLGSAGAYAIVGSDAWHRRMTTAFNALAKRHRRLPWLHGLRMMQMSGQFPFGSVDSADVARNHNRPQNGARKMADRWDGLQGPITWTLKEEQRQLFEDGDGVR